MQNGLIYMTRNREIKTIGFMQQRQSNIELETLIIEDFMPIAVKYQNFVDFSLKRFFGDRENPDQLHSGLYYEPINIFVDYLVNNKSFDLSNVPDSQFIPSSTEIFISYNQPPNNGGGGGGSEIDYSVALSNILDKSAEIEIAVRGINQYSSHFANLPLINNGVGEANSRLIDLHVDFGVVNLNLGSLESQGNQTNQHLFSVNQLMENQSVSLADLTTNSDLQLTQLSAMKDFLLTCASELVAIKNLLVTQELLITENNAKQLTELGYADASGVKLQNILATSLTSTGYLNSIDSKTP